MSILVFKRYEKKYLITEEKYLMLMERIRNKLVADRYSRNLVNSTYFDTDTFLLVRNSIDAENYKEKLRLRTYGDTDQHSRAYLEIKKKLDGVVYKRRVELSFAEAMFYIERGVMPCDSQIMREIDYAFELYSRPTPKIYIFYEREAYACPSLSDLRITFDRNVRYRTDEPLACFGSHGKPIMDTGQVLMEIKSGGAMPLWLSKALSELEIYPEKFSKCGRAYYDYLKTKIKKLSTV